MKSIKEAYREKRITGITAISRRVQPHTACGSSSTCTAARRPNVVLNQLYKHTPLQTSFGFNMLALVPVLSRDGSLSTDGNPLEPQVLSLREMLEHFIAHRKVVIRRRTRYDLARREDRAHILEGFRIALDHIDEVIKIVREATRPRAARERLIERFTAHPTSKPTRSSTCACAR